MFDPLEIPHDKHIRRVPEQPIIGSFIPVQHEGIDHNLCALRVDGQWIDVHGFVCSRCSYKRGVPK